jgi:hypothetical protein
VAKAVPDAGASGKARSRDNSKEEEEAEAELDATNDDEQARANEATPFRRLSMTLPPARRTKDAAEGGGEEAKGLFGT